MRGKAATHDVRACIILWAWGNDDDGENDDDEWIFKSLASISAQTLLLTDSSMRSPMKMMRLRMSASKQSIISPCAVCTTTGTGGSPICPATTDTGAPAARRRVVVVVAAARVTATLRRSEDDELPPLMARAHAPTTLLEAAAAQDIFCVCV